MKWDPQERVEEPTAWHALVSVAKSFGVGEARPPGISEYSVTTAAEDVASTVVESVDSCEVPPQGEVSEAEESCFVVFSQEHILERRVRQRIVEKIEDTPVLLDVEEHVFTVCRRGQWETGFERCVSAWRWQETEVEDHVSVWSWQENEPKGYVSEYKVLHGRHRLARSAL